MSPKIVKVGGSARNEEEEEERDTRLVVIGPTHKSRCSRTNRIEHLCD